MELNHLAIIPDGARRYSEKYNISIKQSYQKSIEQLFKVCEVFYNLEISEISVFGFSTENWNREQEQVSILHKLFLINGIKYLKNQNKDIKITFVGDLKRFDTNLINVLRKISLNNPKTLTKLLNICLNYNGRQEIADSLKYIKNYEINEIQKHLSIKNDVDLLIRTGGEQRISGFLLWQINYAEIFFEKKLWNELTEKDCKIIYNWYKRRNRRFGK